MIIAHSVARIVDRSGAASIAACSCAADSRRLGPAELAQIGYVSENRRRFFASLGIAGDETFDVTGIEAGNRRHENA